MLNRYTLEALIRKSLILRKRGWTMALLELAAVITIAFLVFETLTKKIMSESSQFHFGGFTLYYFNSSPPTSDIFSDLLAVPIAYSPTNNETDAIIDDFYKQSVDHYLNKPKGFESEEEITSWLSYQYLRVGDSYGIVFLVVDKENKTFEYKIRTNNAFITTKNYSMHDIHDMYENSDFLGVQLGVDRALLKSINISIPPDHILFGHLPEPSERPLLIYVFLWLYTIVAFGYLIVVVSLVREVLQETCSGMKQIMNIMGVSFLMYWAHWLIYVMLLHLPFSFVFAYILTKIVPPFSFLNFFIMWVLVFFYTLNCMIILFVVSSLFRNPTVGISACVFGWLTLHFVAVQVFSFHSKISYFFNLLFTILPLHNLIWILYSIASFHGTWDVSKITDQDVDRKRISLALSLFISVLDLIIFSCILKFLDTKRTDSIIYKIPELVKWCLKLSKIKNVIPSRVRSFSFESSPEGMEVVFDLQNVYKKYGLFSKITAVENMNLTLYKGEVLALLGQSGAGKSSTMSMVSGLILPSSGQILFDGKNIVKQKTNYQKYLGLCTQKNVLFPKLTVMDHLIFFGMIKGSSYLQAVAKGTQLLRRLKMFDKKDHVVSELPGGLRRKLSFAISLVGSPTVLILDEPTSGMDPQSRHDVWDILLEERGRCTVMITTHDMEEVDVLSDRIAIIDYGKVVCCGSTTFLKKRYNVGYHVEVLIHPNSSQSDISYVVSQYVTQLEVEMLSQTHINFIIKENFVDRFPSLFEALEKHSADLGITGISVKCTTMEDVFFKVTAGPDEDNHEDIQEIRYGHSIEQDDKSEGCEVFYQRLETLFLKRIRYQFRRMSTLLIMLFVITLVVYVLGGSVHDECKDLSVHIHKALPIHWSMYNDYKITILFDEQDEKIARKSANLIKQQNGYVEIFNTGNESYMGKHIRSNQFFHTLMLIKFLGDNITVQYRAAGHSACVAVNLLSNILLANSTDPPAGSIRVINHPHGDSDGECQVSSSQFKAVVMTSWFYLFFIITLTALMVDFIHFLVEERVNGFKLQQLLAGVSPGLYVVVNLVFDYIVYLFVTSIYLPVYAWRSGDLFLQSSYLTSLLVVLALYGLSGILLSYLVSFFVDNTIIGSCIYFILGVSVTFCAIYIVQQITLDDKLYFFLINVFSFNPIFAAMMAVRSLLEAMIDEYMCKMCSDHVSCAAANTLTSALRVTRQRNGILIYILYLLFDSILYTMLLLSFEYGLWRKASLLFYHERRGSVLDGVIQDADIDSEIERVMAAETSYNEETILKVANLVKAYASGQMAVNGVSFTVSKGECFGLLGVNGAGKTSVFRILAGDLIPNRGKSVIHKYSVLTHRRKYQRYIGYCPQQDALLDMFTGYETLKMICYLKGIPRQEVEKEVDKWFSTMGMTDFAQGYVGDYSCGVRRKLSIAMAFVGDPPVILLDEPTTGVDPTSRRRVWNVVESGRKAGHAIVLSSHSMAECDALCTRLTILKDGMMRCIGTSEYLKEKFSQGYTIMIKLNAVSRENLDYLKEQLYVTFPKSVIIGDFANVIHYQVYGRGILLSVLFSELLRIRKKYEFIEEFTVSNTTLEHLFLSIIKYTTLQSKRRSRSSSFRGPPDYPTTNRLQ